jgi:hypothetical protein
MIEWIDPSVDVYLQINKPTLGLGDMDKLYVQSMLSDKRAGYIAYFTHIQASFWLRNNPL